MKNLYSSSMIVAAFIVFGPASAAGLLSERDKDINALGSFSLPSRLNGGVGSNQGPGSRSEQPPGVRQENQFNALSICYRIKAGNRKGSTRVEDLTGFVNRTQLSPFLSSGLWILLPASGNVASRSFRISDFIVVCAKWTRP
jgi:hypothetical protein